MRIEILDLLPATETGKGPVIAFSGMSGRAWAQWCGSEVPQVGALVDVEVDIPDEVTHWVTVDGPGAMVSGDPGAPVRIRGVVAGVDEDSVVAARVGADIVLLEFAAPANSVQPGHDDKPMVGDSIEFTAARIDVYPYSV
ncbi:hypothetical protein AQI88_33310 [Streptomyces cellostaticus]|uniref:Uncharacterized protein n=1 Tax=Streptomyces cellostaticus TaxID=67285 RepID=A0A101NFL1_9ACTN|nr:hypothetical protein [Streptomyces cellostaticus]KUM92072.1 hypothetical protein AQI88_33310 [Streptomyces cellostaticus]